MNEMPRGSEGFHEPPADAPAQRPGPAPDDAPVPVPESRSWLTRYAGLPQIGWTPLTVFFGILTAIGISFVGTLPIAIADRDLESTVAKNLAQGMVAAGLAGAALIFALSDAGGRLREALRRLGLRGFALRIIGIAVVGWLAYVALAALASPLLQPEQQDITREIGGDDQDVLNLVIGGFLIVIVAPISEELFFRGFMFAGLRSSMPIWPAAVISAIVWGSLHLTGGNVGVAVQIAIFGVVLAWLYERSGTLWAPVVAHAINNTIAFVLLSTDVL